MDEPVLVGVVYVAFAAVPAAIAVVPWRNRDSPGGVPLTVAVVGAAGTALFHGLVLLLAGTGGVPAVASAFLFAVSIEVATLGTFYLAAEYTGRTWLERPALVAVVVAVILPGTLGATAASEGFAVPAPMLFEAANNGMTILVSVVALAMFADQYLGARGVYRKQSGALFLGFGIATASGILQVILGPQVYNLVPIGVTVGSGVIAWALFRYEVLETVPVARKTLFEHLSDPVLALDGDGRLVDHNDAAGSLFGFGDGALGQRLSALFEPTPELADRSVTALDDGERVGAVVDGDRRHFERDHPTVAALLAGEAPEQSIVGIDRDGRRRYFDVSVSPFGAGPSPTGRLVVFRDVTAQQQREDELGLLKEVLSRVLRHNLRNDLTAIKGYAQLVHDEADGQVAAAAERILRTSDDLVETSEKARRIEDVIEADERRGIVLAEVVEDAVESVATDHPEAEFETDVPDGLSVRANDLLGVGLAALVENGVVHSDADRPRVEVEARRRDSWVEVTVSDNGPGIPETELAALQQGGETPLIHSSGAGLWLVYTVAEESGGRVTYETGEGTSARLSLRAEDSD